jgi:uncharacterized protein (TIGR02996 family)
MSDPHLSALWRGVLAKPDDDAPRLVYADWLDELGEAEHAAFIREQIELVRTPPASQNRRAVVLDRHKRWISKLVAGRMDLLDPGGVVSRVFRKRKCQVETVDDGLGLVLRVTRKINGCEYVNQSTVAVTSFNVRCGFVSGVRTTLGSFLLHVWELFTLAPMTAVRMPTRRPSRSPVNPNGHGEMFWCWQRVTPPNTYMLFHEITAALFDVMRDLRLHDVKYDDENYGYDTLGWWHEEQAVAALEKALVVYGRQVAVRPTDEEIETSKLELG